MFERSTDRARRVVDLAQEEARMLNHGYLSTEHLLLGLLREGDGIAARALVSLGVSYQAARQVVEEMLGRGPQGPSGQIPLTERATKVLDLASEEARVMTRGGYAGTEHILLALTRDDGVAHIVLGKLGLSPDRIRHQVTQFLQPGPGYSPPKVPSASWQTDGTAAAGKTGAAGDRGEMARLRGEIERLRALLRAHGIDPDTGHGH